MKEERLRNCLRISGVSLLLLCGCLLPSIITGLTVANNHTMTAWIIIIINAILQSVLALIGGFRIIYESTNQKGDMCSHKDETDDKIMFLGFDITDISTLLNGKYLLFSLPMWILVNIIYATTTQKLGVRTIYLV